MNEHDQDRMKKMLQQALPPTETSPEASRDLWPDVLRRVEAGPLATQARGWVWFDGALAAGIAIAVVSFPASIPVLLYYL